MDDKMTVCLDFDGVIHSYVSGWKGAECIPDPPVRNAKWAVDRLRKTFRVVIYSARVRLKGGKVAVEEWLKRHGIEVDGIYACKPNAFVYVDDRGLKFDGVWSNAVFDIISFRSYLDLGKDVKEQD